MANIPVSVTSRQHLAVLLNQVVDVTDLAASQPSAIAAVDVGDAQAELEAARAQVAQLQAQMQVQHM
jgi:hypothetical protein